MVGNIIEINDDAHQAVIFDRAVVEARGRWGHQCEEIVPP
jgi:hypothetical protein